MESQQATPFYTNSNHPAFLYEDMLADEQRMLRYRKAIERVVKPGDVVADLGTGLGVLAMMAIQAGAKHVYAIDCRPQVMPITQQIINDNGMQEEITLICADARQVKLNVQVDVVLNELIGDFGTDENIAECVEQFAIEHLKPGGKVLPETLTTFLVPVMYGDEYKGIWRDNFHLLDMRAVADIPCKEEAQMLLLTHPVTELASPAVIESIDFHQRNLVRQSQHQVCFDIEHPGMLQGFMGFFHSKLVSDVTIDNYPGYQGCHWQTWHWPVYPQKHLQKGQRLSACLNTPENMVAPGWSLNWELT